MKVAHYHPQRGWETRTKAGNQADMRRLIARLLRIAHLVWLADALHVRMSAATNPNQWREFRKDQIVQQRAASPEPPLTAATTVPRGHRAARSPHPSPHLRPNHLLNSSPDRARSPATRGGSMS